MCLSAAEGLRETLSGAPREATHLALAEPASYLGGRIDRGTSAAQEDACIAYSLFLPVRPSRVSRF